MRTKTAGRGFRTPRTPTSVAGSSGSVAPMAITLDQVRRVVSDAVSGGIATIGGLKIDKYDGRISADALEWLDSYIDATNLKGWNDDQRFLNFNQFLFKNAKNWYRLYVKRATSPPTNWAELMDAFIDYHVPKDMC